jgi:hypothetical protein
MSDLAKITKNFGHINTLYGNILSESVISKNEASKKLFKNYLKTIREDEILKTQFLVYSNIENKVESDINKATMFVKENIDLFSKYLKKDIFEANKKLVYDLIFEQEVENEKLDLHENIATLIFTEKTPQNIDTIVEATNKVVDYIMNNKPYEINETIDLPMSMVTTMLVEKYNQKYSILDESQKKVLKVLVESNDEERKVVYNELLTECLTLINEKLDTSDLDTKDKLLRVKEKLLNDKQEINEDFIKNISKLVELRDGLKD